MLHLIISIKAVAALITVTRPRKKPTFKELRAMAKPARGIQYKNNYPLTHLAGRMPF